MTRRLFAPPVVFFLVLLVVLLALFRERAFYDPGALWHVRVGEIVLDRGFTWTDPFTFTFAGQTWIPQQWGAEVLMALGYRAGGFDTMLLGFAAGVAGLYAWIFARALRGGMKPLLAGVVAGGFLAAGAFHYFVRPHMFTIALLAWTTACLIDFERGRAGLSRLAWLVPLFVVWTNLHGGVLGGVVTLGLAVAGWTAWFLVARGPDPDTPIRSWRTAGLLITVVVACGLTPLVNPFGLEMLRTWSKLVGSPVLKQFVSEHMPLDPAKAPDQVVLAVGAAYLVLLAGVLPARPRVSWLLPLVWFGLTFQSIRQGPLFAVTAAVAAVDFWPHTIWHRLLKRHGDSLVADPESDAAGSPFGWATFVVPIAAVLLVFGLQVGGVTAPVVGRGWAGLNPEFTPVDLNDAVASYAASVPPGTPIFNDANLGGYLIFYAPSLKIFMDDRCELYGDAWIKKYAELSGMPPEGEGEPDKTLEKWHADYHFERAVVQRRKEMTGLEAYFSTSPRWREVARGQGAILYARVTP